MLVHLKPRRTSKQHEVMQNYIQTANWNYNTSNAIHCKKNIATSKLERILTNRVSANGQSLSPKHPSSEYFDNKNDEPKSLRGKQREQKQQERKKKQEKQKKCVRVELATVYKKTFKYNTTMHQILKNIKKSECRHKKQTCEDEKHANHNFQLKLQLQNEVQTRQSKWEQKEDNYLSKSGEKIRMLQNIKKKCTSLEVDEGGCKTNQLKFSEGEKCKSMIKTTIFEWKSIKPHYTKLNWRKESHFRNILKQSICTCPKSLSNIRVLQNNLTDTLIAEENPIDCLFYSCEDGKEHSPCKSNSQRLEIEPCDLKQVKKFQTMRQSYKKCIESEPNYSFLRNKKFSLKPAIVSNAQFSVEAWNTKDKERQWDELPHAHD